MYETHIDIKGRDEFAELATGFNTIADDIQGMLDAKRQLLLAISHELRSPLTRAKVTTELLDDQSRKAQLHQELVADAGPGIEAKFII